MNNGQLLSDMITKILATHDLTIEQQAKLDTILGKTNGNGYIPDTLDESLDEIDALMENDDVEGLITRLRIYPLASVAYYIEHYIDNVKCDVGEFMRGDTLKGVRSYKAIGKKPDVGVDIFGQPSDSRNDKAHMGMFNNAKLRWEVQDHIAREGWLPYADFGKVGMNKELLKTYPTYREIRDYVRATIGSGGEDLFYKLLIYYCKGYVARGSANYTKYTQHGLDESIVTISKPSAVTKVVSLPSNPLENDEFSEGLENKMIGADGKRINL